MKSLRPISRHVLVSSVVAAMLLTACGSDAATSDPAGSAADTVPATAEVLATDTASDAAAPDTAATDTTADDAAADGEADAETDSGEAAGACALFTLDEVAAAAGQPVAITEGNDNPEQCDYEGNDKLPVATVLLQPDDGEQLQIGRIVLDSLATSVDDITVGDFAGVHGHDLDAGFAMYDTAAVTTGPMILSVSLYGGESTARSTGVLSLLDLGVPRL